MPPPPTPEPNQAYPHLAPGSAGRREADPAIVRSSLLASLAHPTTSPIEPNEITPFPLSEERSTIGEASAQVALRPPGPESRNRPRTPIAPLEGAWKPNIKPLDYQALEYVDQADDTLFCPICQTPFFDPVTTTTCGHTFCKNCLHLALRNSFGRICPMDRQPLLRKRAWVKTMVLNDQVDQLRVRCPNYGCEAILTRELLAAHYEKECEWTRVPCEAPKDPTKEHSGVDMTSHGEDDEKCWRPVARRDTGRGKKCLHTPTSCQFCAAPVLEADLEKHYQTVCEKAKTKCGGCDGEVVRHRMANHLLLWCPEAETKCKWQIHGCTTVEKRRVIHQHEHGCVFKAIAEMTKKMNDDLAKMAKERDEDRAALRHAVREIESEWKTGSELLDILTLEVEQVKTEIGDLRKVQADMDGRAKMLHVETAMLGNQIPELARDVGSVTIQTNWLTNALFQRFWYNRPGVGLPMGASGAHPNAAQSQQWHQQQQTRSSSMQEPPLNNVAEGIGANHGPVLRDILESNYTHGPPRRGSDSQVPKL